MDAENILIRNAIVHILDRNTGLPVLSDYLLEYDEDFYDCIKKYIINLLIGDDKKECTFDFSLSTFYQELTQFTEDMLIPFSQKIADWFYQIMQDNEEIPSGDLIIATCQLHTDKYLAVLKLNYKEDFTHLTCTKEDKNENHIIKHRAILPSGSARLSEAAIINLTDYSIYVTEKKYKMNGHKSEYLSEFILQCHSRMSEKSKMQLITKTINQLNEKHFEEDFHKKLAIKQTINEELLEQEDIPVYELQKKLYEDYPSIQEEFQEQMEKYDIITEKIHPENPKTTKKLEKQFLTTDSGIEINIPMEIYKDNQSVEFITNADGTISVTIKNIKQLFTK